MSLTVQSGRFCFVPRSEQVLILLVGYARRRSLFLNIAVALIGVAG